MIIKRPNETGKLRVACYRNPSLLTLAQHSFNRVTDLHIRAGRPFCRLNGERIRTDEAERILQDLFFD